MAYPCLRLLRRQYRYANGVHKNKAKEAAEIPIPALEAVFKMGEDVMKLSVAIGADKDREVLDKVVFSRIPDTLDIEVGDDFFEELTTLLETVFEECAAPEAPPVPEAPTPATGAEVD